MDLRRYKFVSKLFTSTVVQRMLAFCFVWYYRYSLIINSDYEKRCIQGVPKSDTFINYVYMMSYKVQNTRYLHCLNNFNICYYWFTQLCAQRVHPAAVQPKRVFCSVWWCTILLESPSVLTTLDSDIRQQSFTKNTFTVIPAAYFCSRFNENNASFAHTRDTNRNHHAVHLTPTQTPKGCHFLGTHYMHSAKTWEKHEFIGRCDIITWCEHLHMPHCMCLIRWTDSAV